MIGRLQHVPSADCNIGVWQIVTLVLISYSLNHFCLELPKFRNGHSENGWLFVENDCGFPIVKDDSLLKALSGDIGELE